MRVMECSSNYEGGLVWHFGSSLISNDNELTISFRFDRDTEVATLKYLASLLRENNVAWVRPLNSPVGVWVIDLDELKKRFPDFLQPLDWLKGRIQLDPEFITHEYINDEQRIERDSYVRFMIVRYDVKAYTGLVDFPELTPYLENFQLFHPDPNRCGFLIIRYEDTPLHQRIITCIKETCARYGIEIMLARDNTYADQIFPNICTYMHGCGFGVAVFDRIKEDYFNPNISFEIGYMMAQKKPVCLLKDSTLRALHADLVGHLYTPFDTQDPEGTLPQVLERWLSDKGLIG